MAAFLIGGVRRVRPSPAVRGASPLC